MRFEFGDADGVSRPFLDFRLIDDGMGVVSRGLVDTGSAHTVLPWGFSAAFARMEPQRHVARLALGGYTDVEVPEFSVSLEIVGSNQSEALRFETPVLVTRCELPFAIIGFALLRHVVVVVRAYEGVLHILPRSSFEHSAHMRDPLF
jgi:hypothetical protein